MILSRYKTQIAAEAKAAVNYQETAAGLGYTDILTSS